MGVTPIVDVNQVGRSLTRTFPGSAVETFSPTTALCKGASAAAADTVVDGWFSSHSIARRGRMADPCPATWILRLS